MHESLVSLLLLGMSLSATAAPAPLERRSRGATRIMSGVCVQCELTYTDDGEGYLVKAYTGSKNGLVPLTSTRLEVGDVVLTVGAVRCAGSGKRLDVLLDAARASDTPSLTVRDIRTGNILTVAFPPTPR